MEMFNPPHPGEILLEIFLIPREMSEKSCAEKLGLPLIVFQRLLAGLDPIDSELAGRLGKTLGTSSEMWLAMQKNYDSWQAKQAGA